MSEPARQFAFPRRARLKKSGEFQAVFAARQSISDNHLVLYMRANTLGYSRLGLGVGRKLGNAVRRNRYKRTLREAWRTMQGSFPPGHDYVLIPRQTPTPTSRVYGRSLRELVQRWQRRYGRVSERH